MLKTALQNMIDYILWDFHAQMVDPDLLLISMIDAGDTLIRTH